MGDMKKVLGTLIAIFSSIIVCAATPAQDSFFDNYVSQTWGAFGGLTGTTATDIIQTKDGFINIGTYEGLVRFDGVEFNTLKKTKENGLSFVSVRNVIQDSKGVIMCPSGVTYTTPAAVPTQMLPDLSSTSARTELFGSPFFVVNVLFPFRDSC